jgi:hypothetical protein
MVRCPLSILVIVACVALLAPGKVVADATEALAELQVLTEQPCFMQALSALLNAGLLLISMPAQWLLCRVDSSPLDPCQDGWT